jgi:hypothetical protein
MRTDCSRSGHENGGSWLRLHLRDTEPQAAAPVEDSRPKPQPQTLLSEYRPTLPSKPQSAANLVCSHSPSPICRLQTLISGSGSDTLALQSYDIIALRLQLHFTEVLLSDVRRL